tara:strand:+ start:325 stop:1233 length:909 start_codon:yes stop_codon:yes gene_type:complete
MLIFYVLLVLIWSTGFIIGKFIVGLIDPNVYLTIRFTAVALLFFVLAKALKRPFPVRKDLPKHFLAGTLLNAFYLSLAYIALAQGLPAGIMALIGALQPLLVTCLALVLIKERTSFLGMTGMLIAISGLLLVISPSLTSDASFSPWLALLGGAGVLSLALGSVYQKMSIADSDIVSAMAVQNFAAAVVSGAFALALGEHLFVVSWQSFALVAWGVLVLSCGGVFLLIWLLRKIPAARVSTLMLLVPPLAAIEGYLLFNESLSPLQIAGIIVTLSGVLLSRLTWPLTRPKGQKHSQDKRLASR